MVDTICSEHFEGLDLTAENISSPCRICELAEENHELLNRLQAVGFLFRGIKFSDVQKLSPELTEAKFNDFKILLYGPE